MFVTGRLFYQTLTRKNPKSFDKSIYFTAIVKKPLHSWSHLIKQLINARTVSDFFFHEFISFAGNSSRFSIVNPNVEI